MLNEIVKGTLGLSELAAGLEANVYAYHFPQTHPAEWLVHDLDHLAAGIGIPLLVASPSSGAKDGLILGSVLYGILSTDHEFAQYIFTRGSFQADQLTADFIGIGIACGIAYLIDRYIPFKKPRHDIREEEFHEKKTSNLENMLP